MELRPTSNKERIALSMHCHGQACHSPAQCQHSHWLNTCIRTEKNLCLGLVIFPWQLPIIYQQTCAFTYPSICLISLRLIRALMLAYMRICASCTRVWRECANFRGLYACPIPHLSPRKPKIWHSNNEFESYWSYFGWSTNEGIRLKRFW